MIRLWAPALAGEARWAFLTRPGAWFWALVVIGLAARIYLATATAGTPDVRIWTRHARMVAEHGLIAHYSFDTTFNHPPVIAWSMGRVQRLSGRLGIPFPSVYRVVIGLVDLGSAFLILRVMRESRWRYAACGAYCVAPVALLLAGLHGNTDPLVAACLLVTAIVVSQRRAVAAGVLIGIIANIKVPGLFAAPALAWALPRWRDRVVCALVALAIALPPYAWVITRTTELTSGELHGQLGANFVIKRLFFYRGYLMAIKGEPHEYIWGLKSFANRILGRGELDWPAWARWWIEHSYLAALPLMLLFGFLRRRHSTARGIAVTIAGTYAIFYSLVETWATQYLAWSMPFWMLAGLPFAVASNALAGGYVYLLYAGFSGDWLLRLGWPFGRTVSDMPPGLFAMRDLAILMFLVFALYWFARAIHDEWRAWTGPRAQPPPPSQAGR